MGERSTTAVPPELRCPHSGRAAQPDGRLGAVLNIPVVSPTGDGTTRHDRDCGLVPIPRDAGHAAIRQGSPTARSELTSQAPGPGCPTPERVSTGPDTSAAAGPYHDRRLGGQRVRLDPLPRCAPSLGPRLACGARGPPRRSGAPGP